MSVATASPPSQQEAGAPSQQAMDGRDICEPGEALLAADRSVHNTRDPFPETTLGDAMPRCASGPPSKAHGVSSPTAGDGDGSATLSWPGMTAGVTAVVSGGTYAVDTGALTGFATTLTDAAGYLDDARAHVLDAEAEARAAIAPPESDEESSGALSRGDGSASTGATWSDPMCYSGLGGAGLPSCGASRDPWREPSGFEALRTSAIDAATALTTGVGSLQDAADSLRTLAADVTACVRVYDGAESGASTATRAGGGAGLGSLGAASWGALGLLMGTTSPAGLLLLLGAGKAVTNPGLTAHADGDLADVLDDLAVVMSDADLSEWVRKDLMTIAVLVDYARAARTGREGAAVETYLAGVAERLDPEISRKLPAEVMTDGGRMVPASSLTPMERVAYYMSMLSAGVAAKRYGDPTGTTVTVRGGPPVTIPPAAEDPMAWGADVPALTGSDGAAAQGAANGAALSRPLGTAADVIRYSDSLKVEDDDPSSGVVGIVRTVHADGTSSWVVVVPGTTDWGLGGTNPQDLLTNLQAVAGAPNDMESAVVTAMRRAGIGPDDPVGLYGHSQGAIVAANIAADPAVNERYNVTTLLTAGGPTAGADLPDNVNALHIENNADAVPGLDGAPTPRTPTRTVVTVDTTGSGAPGYPHGGGVYADAVEGMRGDPTIDAWTERLGALTGTDEQGATTSAFVFDVTRSTTGASSRADLTMLALGREPQTEPQAGEPS